MSGSLRNTQISNEPVHTKAVITSSVKSLVGSKWMWIIVEDEDDKRVYQKFMTERARVLPSLSENGSKGCKNVEQITHDLITANVTRCVAGIRDADYVRFETPEHVLPQQVYLTDQRDVEMQMLSSPSVQKGLAAWNGSIPTHLADIYANVAHERGCMRLISDVYSLGCSFKDEAPVSHLWDSNKRCMADNWQNVMHEEFFSHCKNTSSSQYPFTVKKYAELKRKKSLDTISHYLICQGHDVVTLLQYRLGKNQYNAPRIMAKMTECYALADFQQTQLHADLRSLEKHLNVAFLR